MQYRDRSDHDPRRTVLARLGALWLGMSLAAGFLLLAPAQASAAFSCGTGWTLYTTSGGVRCVRQATSTRYVWYAEGTNAWGRYRHIALAHWNSSRGYWVGTSADLHGNGEALNNFYDGTLEVRTSGGSMPTTFTVQPWGETWTKVTSGTTSSYTTPWTEPATDCGSNFNNRVSGKLAKFRVQNFAGTDVERHTGLRCALRTEPTSATWDIWYAAGRYFTRSSAGTSPTPTAWTIAPYAAVGYQTSQYNLCRSGWHCYQFPSNLIQNPHQFDNGTGVRISGQIGELWIPARKKHALRVKVMRAANSDGTRETPASTQDIRDYIASTNQVFAAADIELIYETRFPSGAEPDEVVVRNTSLNAMSQLSPASAERIGLYHGERFPERVVMLFTWGADPVCPTGGGASNTSGNLINTASLRNSCGTRMHCGRILDTLHFAHEFGHYLGLDHTHAFDPWFASKTDAEKEFNDGGCNRAIFDGDGLSSTGEDLSIASHECDIAITRVSLMCKSTGVPADFVLPRNNVMSYYDVSGAPAATGTTSQQRSRVTSTLTTNSKRKRLQ